MEAKSTTDSCAHGYFCVLDFGLASSIHITIVLLARTQPRLRLAPDHHHAILSARTVSSRRRMSSVCFVQLTWPLSSLVSTPPPSAPCLRCPHLCPCTRLCPIFASPARIFVVLPLHIGQPLYCHAVIFAPSHFDRLFLNVGPNLVPHE